MAKVSQSQVMAVIEKALEIKPGQLGENTRAEDVDIWDSLGQLSILVALDQLFDGKIANINEMADADSVPKILSILKQHSLL
jgi:acyl carrier protein